MKAKRIIITGTVLLILIGLITLWPREDEPSYQGKTLSQWIDSYSPTRAFKRPGPSDADSPDVQAVRAIGTNALPFLLDWIRYEPSPSKTFYERATEKLPWQLWTGDSAELRARRAEIGFAMLGEIGTPAIQELAKLATVSGSNTEVNHAIIALMGIGPPAFPALVEVIMNPKAVGRNDAIISIGVSGRVFGTNANPMLLACLKARDTRVALPAAQALAELKAESAIVCTRLAMLLQDPDYHRRCDAIDIIPYYGEQARILVPDLLEALADTNPIVRKRSENVLRRIAPEVLTNAPAN